MRLGRLIRDLHLFSGLVLCVVVLLYTITGAAIFYLEFLPAGGADRVTTAVHSIPPAHRISGPALRAFVQDVGGRGRTPGLRPTPDGGHVQRWDRPGVTTQATVSADTAAVRVERRRHSAMRTLRVLHTVKEYRGGWAYAGWAFLLDLVSLATIGFAVTGAILWYRMTRRRALGWTLLGVSWVFGLGLAGYLLWG